MPTSPAIVTEQAARRLPRWVLWLLCSLYIVPGWLGREPWRQADLGSFAAMWDLAQHPEHWLMPQVLGEATTSGGWLPYWLGAAFIHALPWLPADLAARTPFALLMVLTLLSTWYAMFHLARLPGAQPVSFAFGGEARPLDYARALADTAVLALLASLGLALLAHEASASPLQLAASSLLFYAAARLVSPNAHWHGFGAALWALGSLGLALSGAPWLTLGLGAGYLLLAALSQHTPATRRQRWILWVACAGGSLIAVTLAISLAGGWVFLRPTWPSAGLPAMGGWRFAQLAVWFTWPVGLIAAWAVWRWHRRWREEQVLLPLWGMLCVLLTAALLPQGNRAMLLGLPALSCLAALALPTLTRRVTAWIDWFALLFFTAGAAVIWLMYVAMMTGVPAKPAANVAKLTPGFEPPFVLFHVLAAAAATLIWCAVLRWRIGHHRPALWKGLVLSAAGTTLCWVLLMTLWLPLLNHGLGQASVSRRIAVYVPSSDCTLVAGLDHGQIGSLQYHGGLSLLRLQGPEDPRCRFLLVTPQAREQLGIDQWDGWERQGLFTRLRQVRDSLVLYRRQ